MLDRIILYSIKNKLVIGLFTLALIVWGSFSLTRLPIDAVPDITNNQVQVITVASSQSALDIERLVTFPIEQAVATIPDLIEVRSFSRFGLSVITIVFKDDVDIYKARQQVSERLNEVRSLIPQGIGNPEMAPVTTGLGEIYQYVVHTKPGYEKNYTAMDLRTIQDWIIRRQLLGTEGVADVSSFGGYLKQYEISLNPDKLQSMNIGISDVFNALEKNNQNTGGAYIDKTPNSWYIRSEGLIGSLQDIENIVVKTNSNGIPVLIRDIATVGFGSAVRYGAMTRNAEGEVTGAIVLMLKGANSSKVISNVKERIAKIEKTLPEGITIEPFLDRTKLVNNAIQTVTKNLAEGALIVIFVLVLLLGNMRAGLIVASVIPLSMLFAVSLMNVFGVSGNLMSLGAIDFGLIVDGAVIIVEATMHHLGLNKLRRTLTQTEMDEEVEGSAKKMMKSAAFGQIIILIVYLPILALVGIEGKMFKPMAQTVSFAIIGAFILSLTYVPMISSLFLSKKIEHKRSISDRIMDFLHRIYEPLLQKVIKHAKAVVLIAVFMFVGVLFLFGSLGAEFLPQLDEGDFAIETRVLVGSSLSETINASTQAAAILKKEFPDEVKEVVGKIGSSEIPTDPMPIEACDVIVVLNDRSQWKKAENRNELAEKMASALEAIPGVTFGFQQPIQMRFNELMTGARQDVVVKIYGEDLDKLSEYATQTGKIVSTIDGAKDLYVEQATGLPQIVISYNRSQIARYGMNINDINQAVNAAFAGQSAGMVYEGEKRFDLVVRLNKERRQQIEDVQNLYVPASDGRQVPLMQVADVQFKIGPNQIQRDDAKRRIIIGFNVRGRDVESIVNELKAKMDKQINFEVGYYATYGGSFKNLEEARTRLSIALPVALLLIFILLYFAFQSISQGLLIYSAIPLSAVGGVLALWVRDMPFSISAGIGFIALFGVAVLNGIVLIAQFNQLKAEGLTDIKEIILKGTSSRLRPVIMTALVASLGFLPMALSHGSGAEVQKPLATVVIGGLISATLLTLFVLPCLYLLFGHSKKRKATISLPIIVLLLLFASNSSQAQTTLSLDDCIKTALQNNPQLKGAVYKVNQQEVLRKTAFDLGKTQINYTQGQYNSIFKKDNNITLSQSFEFPTLMLAQGKLQKERIQLADQARILTEKELIREVKTAYYQLAYAQQRLYLLKTQDSIYNNFVKLSELRYKTGETSNLEKLAAQGKSYEIALQQQQAARDVIIYEQQLQKWLGIEQPIIISAKVPLLSLSGYLTDTATIKQNPLLVYYQQQIKVAEAGKSVERNRLLPDISVGYFNQTLVGTQNINGTEQYFGLDKRFSGFSISVAIPLWYRPQQGRIQAAKMESKVAEAEYENTQNMLKSGFNQLLQQYQQAQISLEYYQNQGLKHSEVQLQTVERAYRAGDIGYVEYLQGISQAISIKEQYLIAFNQLNQIAIQLQYIIGDI